MVMMAAMHFPFCQLNDDMWWSPEVSTLTSVSAPLPEAGTATAHICCVPSMAEMKSRLSLSVHATFWALWSKFAERSVIFSVPVS